MTADTAPRPAATDRGGTAARAGAGAATGPTGAEAMGGIRAPAGAETARETPAAATAPVDLSKDQVRRLQIALNEAGCNAGTADGVVGRQTRQAMACGLEKNDLRSNDLKGLYRALGLDFD